MLDRTISLKEQTLFEAANGRAHTLAQAQTLERAAAEPVPSQAAAAGAKPVRIFYADGAIAVTTLRTTRARAKKEKPFSAAAFTRAKFAEHRGNRASLSAMERHRPHGVRAPGAPLRKKLEADPELRKEVRRQRQTEADHRHKPLASPAPQQKERAYA
jgi:hypothetical protein